MTAATASAFRAAGRREFPVKLRHFLATTASVGDGSLMEKLRNIVGEMSLYLIGGLLGLAGLISMIPGAVLLMWTFNGGWDLGNPTYLLIFCLGCLTPVLFLSSSGLVIARPQPKYLWLALLAIICAVGFVHAFSLPGAKNILH